MVTTGKRDNPAQLCKRSIHDPGLLTTEMVVAMAILVLCLIPLAYSFIRDQQLCRHYYQRAIAAQIVDGEMEVLVAGAWRAYPIGTHPYAVRAAAVKNLQSNRFVLTRAGNRLRLEYQPAGRVAGAKVVREGMGK
jgi:hypothetical protein